MFQASVPTRSPRLQPQRGERARQAIAALAQLGISRPRDDTTRVRLDDLAVAEPLGRVVEELVDGQAVGLHTLFGTIRFQDRRG